MTETGNCMLSFRLTITDSMQMHAGFHVVCFAELYSHAAGSKQSEPASTGPRAKSSASPRSPSLPPTFHTRSRSLSTSRRWRGPGSPSMRSQWCSSKPSMARCTRICRPVSRLWSSPPSTRRRLLRSTALRARSYGETRQ